MDELDKIPYTANPDFNEWLDNDENNVIDIGGLTFPPSEVLYKMNYDQYLEVLDEYFEDDNILFKEVYEEFPMPVAFYLHQAEENYDNPHHRLDLLKSAWESLLFVIFGIVVCESRHRSLPLEDVGINFRDFFSDRLTQKMSIVENIIDHCARNDFPIRPKEIVSLNAISLIRNLNRERNSFSHSLARTPEQQIELYNELRIDFIQVLKEVRNLKEVNLFRYHSNSVGGPLFPRCDIFNGHSLSGAKKVLQISQDDYSTVLRYFNNQSIFAHIGDEIFCCSPFIHFIKNLEDPHPMLLFYKKKVSGGKYAYEIVSRSKEVKIEKAVFEDRNSELRGLL